MIKIFFIDHRHQRYNTVGDYFINEDDPDVVTFRISKTRDRRSQQAVLLHELAEFLLVEQAGIPLQAIDDFDLNYEGRFEEPGDDPAAPYHEQHLFATRIEKLFCERVGLPWRKHEKDLLDLFKAREVLNDDE